MNKKQKRLTGLILVPFVLSFAWMGDAAAGVFAFWFMLAVVYSAIMFMLKEPPTPPSKTP